MVKTIEGSYFRIVEEAYFRIVEEAYSRIMRGSYFEMIEGAYFRIIMAEPYYSYYIIHINEYHILFDFPSGLIDR